MALALPDLYNFFIFYNLKNINIIYNNKIFYKYF